MKKIINSINYFIGNWNKTDSKSFFFSILQIVALVLNPIIIAYIPKVMIESVETKNIKISLLIILCLVVISILLNWIISSSSEMNKAAIYKMQNIFQLNLLSIIEKKDFCDMEKSDFKGEITRVNAFLSSGEFDNIDQIPQTLVNFIANCIGIFTYVIIFSKLNTFVISFIVLSIIFDFKILKISRNQKNIMKEKNRGLFRTFDAISDAAKDSNYAKEIRIFEFGKWFIEKNYNLSSVYKNNVNYYSKITAKTAFFRLIIALIRDGILLISLVISTIDKDLSGSNFIFYFGLIIGFSTWVIGLSQNYNDLNLLCIELLNLKKVLSVSNKKNKYSNNTEIIKILNSDNIIIEFKDVYFKYPNSNNYILNNVNVTFKTNKKIALVGSNGTGKTTLIKLICGFYTPTKGDILFNGVSISKIKTCTKFYELFSAVFQDSVLFPDSIYNNITCSKKQKDIDFDSAITLSNFKETLEKLPNKEKTKLYNELNNDAINLSGGEEQKVLLSRAAYIDAKVLLLDEPSATLDPISEEKLYNSYADISNNKLSIFVSHRLSSTKFCDQIFFISNNTIRYIGTHEELMKNCKEYRNMYHSQSDYYKEKSI